MDKLLNLMQSGEAKGPPGMPSLESMLGPELAGKDLAKEADKLWRFLDNLAEDDPQAYADFLKSQAKAAETEQSKQLVRGNSAQILIEAQLTQPAKAEAVLHIWAARDGTLVPMATVANGAAEVNASTTSWAGVSIPMFESQAPQADLAQDRGQLNSHSTASHQYHIGINPKLMPMLAMNQPPQLRPVLVEAALQFVEARYTLNFNRHMPCVFKVHTSQVQAASRAATATAARSQAGGTPATPHELLKAMASMQATSDDGNSSTITGAGSTPEVKNQTLDESLESKPSNRKLSKQLIQEIHEQQPQSESGQGAAESGNKILGVQHGFDKDGRECLIVEAALPDARGVQDVTVEFTEAAAHRPSGHGSPQESTQTSTLVLSLEGGWTHAVKLPCLVIDSKCTAKFDKRKQVLKVSAPKACPPGGV